MPLTKTRYTAEEAANIIMMDLPLDNSVDTDEESEIEEGDIFYQAELKTLLLQC